MEESAETREQEIPILKFSLLIFKLNLMWPFNKYGQIWKPIHLFVGTGAIFTLAVALMTIYVASQVHAEEVFSATLPELASVGGCVYLYLMTPTVQRELAATLAELADYRQFGGPPASFYHTRRFTETLSIVNFMFSLLAIIAHSGLKLRYKPHCERDRRHGDWFVICGLFSDIMVPFEVTSDLVKYALHIWQFIFFFAPLKGASQLSFTVFEVSQYLKVRMLHLRSMLLRMFAGETLCQQRANFYFCMQYHQDVLQLARRVDDCYRQLMFIHVTMTGFVFASIGNLIIQNHSLADVAHLIAWLVALQVVCTGGQDIIDETAQIRLAMWCSDWYKAHPALQKDFLFMLAMSQRPCCLRAGKFGTLSYALFGGVMKTSYSIITVFRR